jgi:NAD(P)-dependent dehydrogenase (short-subunit alcohol dehydrogenase family)
MQVFEGKTAVITGAASGIGLALAERAIGEFGKVLLLCNNAGVASAAGTGKGVWELEDREWDWVMGVYFYGVLYGLRAFIPHMLEHGEALTNMEEIQRRRDAGEVF